MDEKCVREKGERGVALCGVPALGLVAWCGACTPFFLSTAPAALTRICAGMHSVSQARRSHHEFRARRETEALGRQASLGSPPGEHHSLFQGSMCGTAQRERRSKQQGRRQPHTRAHNASLSFTCQLMTTTRIEETDVLATKRWTEGNRRKEKGEGGKRKEKKKSPARARQEACVPSLGSVWRTAGGEGENTVAAPLNGSQSYRHPDTLSQKLVSAKEHGMTR